MALQGDQCAGLLGEIARVRLDARQLRIRDLAGVEIEVDGAGRQLAGRIVERMSLERSRCCGSRRTRPAGAGDGRAGARHRVVSGAARGYPVSGLRGDPGVVVFHRARGALAGGQHYGGGEHEREPDWTKLHHRFSLRRRVVLPTVPGRHLRRP